MREDTEYFKEDFKQCFREDASHATEREPSILENDSETENLEKICKVIKKVLQYLLSHAVKRAQIQTLNRKERKKESGHFRGKRMAPDGSV